MERLLKALGLSGMRRQRVAVTWLAAMFLLALTPRCQHVNEAATPLSQTARGHPAADDIPSFSEHPRTDLIFAFQDTDYGSDLEPQSVDGAPSESLAPDRATVKRTEKDKDFKEIAAITTLPIRPVEGQALRVIATTRAVDRKFELVLRNRMGHHVSAHRLETWGHLPRARSLYFDTIAAGGYQAVLLDQENSEVAALIEFDVKKRGTGGAAETAGSGVWPVKRNWSPALEDLYSAFIAKLFYVRPGSRKGWRPLHQATRDPFRNILYGSLGLDEDHPNAEVTVKMEPDCGDAPYQIRAYFAWKMQLPFLFNRCERGSAVTGPGVSPPTAI
jgi:hypothetical protein